jgi:hypothetical protein
MQPGRIVAALTAAPLVGALIYVAVAGVDSSRFSHGPTKDDVLSTFIGMAVVAVLFEVFVLLPVAVLLRGRVRFELRLAAIGIIAWVALVAGGLALMGQNAISVAITSAQLLTLGVPVVLLFVALIRKGLTPRSSGPAGKRLLFL